MLLNPNEAPEGFIAVEDDNDDKCSADCALLGCSACANAACSKEDRKDKTSVYFIKKEMVEKALAPPFTHHCPTCRTDTLRAPGQSLVCGVCLDRLVPLVQPGPDSTQADPHGKDPHSAGAKLDANKDPWDLLMDFHPDCIMAPHYAIGFDHAAIWLLISRLKNSRPLDIVMVSMFTEGQVFDVAEYGAKKYTKGGWLTVPDGIKRYRAAAIRHLLRLDRGEGTDPESDLPHIHHVAWNVWAVYTLEQNVKKESP